MFKSALTKDSHKKAYENSLETDKIELTRVCTISGITAFLASALMDLWGLPSILYESLLLRVFIVTVLLTTLISTYYTSFFIKNYSKILVTTFVLVSFAIEYSIYLAKISELAYYTYFSSLIVIFTIIYSWTFLSIRSLSITTISIISGFIFSVLMRDKQGELGALPYLIVSLSILTGAVFIGVLGKLIRDKHLHEKFMLQQSFKELFEEKEKEAESHKHHANHDILTGLPNRRFAETRLNTTYFQQVKQLEMTMVVIFLDLNGFKKINDDYGHDAGDEVLKVTANRLRFCINKKDYLIRLGGDEFLICLTVDNNTGSGETIKNIIKRVRETVSQTIKFEDNNLHVSTSIGVAESEKDSNEINALITIADKRMYEDKQHSKKESSTLNNVTVLPLRA